MRHRILVMEQVRCFMRLEHAFLPQMREKFSSGHELHEDVQASAVLGEALEVNLSERGITMKGWLMLLSILY